MATGAHEQRPWLVEPLLEAGLDLEEIRTLVVRLAFDALVEPEDGDVPAFARPVEGMPDGVRAAWLTVVGRMLDPDETAPAG